MVASFQTAFSCLQPCQKQKVVGQSSNQQQHLNALWTMASMQIKAQSQVLIFYISKAFFDLHAALINRYDLCWIPFALLKIAGKQPWLPFTPG
ncbi:hypothetical protein AOA59_18485 [Pseudomonas sp. 2822-15]|nr:hypothetical protein AOA59_18485 [Pseudomonas sp. 2822-15]